MHRAEENVTIKGSTLKDIFLKHQAKKNLKVYDIDFFAKNIDDVVYTSIDFKYFTREGLYLTDFFIFFFLYFVVFMFDDFLYLSIDLEDIVMSSTPLEDWFNEYFDDTTEYWTLMFYDFFLIFFFKSLDCA